MHGWLPRLVLLAAACAPAGDACAQGWGGAVGLASDNVERGYSLAEGRPAWLADLHYAADAGWVVGLAAGAERPYGHSPGARLVAYLDRHWRIDADWSAKAGLAHYDSPWSDERAWRRYDEINAALGFRGRWRASIAVSPNAAGYGGQAYAGGAPRTGWAAWAELTLHQPLGGPVAAELGVGRAHFARTDGADYTYGNAGVSCVVGAAHVYVAHLWMRAEPRPHAPAGPWPWPYDGGAEPYAAAPAYHAAPASKRRWVASLTWSW
jgi:hypothetical protein